jgi:GNAT superfamily N-acetyltransferase
MDLIDQQTVSAEHPVCNNDSGGRRIIFVTNPENQLRLFVDGLGEAFFQEARLPGEFNVEYWTNQWTLLIKAKFGYMWIMMHGKSAIGGIGVLISPDICDGKLVMQEAFWYVAKEYRGGLHGFRLIKEIEKFAKEAGISRILMGRVHSTDPNGKLGAMYERMGYAPVETNYCKTICHDI